MHTCCSLHLSCTICLICQSIFQIIYFLFLFLPLVSFYCFGIYYYNHLISYIPHLCLAIFKAIYLDKGLYMWESVVCAHLVPKSLH